MAEILPVIEPSPADASPTPDGPESQGQGGEILLTGGDSTPETTAPSFAACDSPGDSPEPPGPPPVPRLDANARRRILSLAPEGIEAAEIERIAGGPLESLPATAESEILRALRDWKPSKPAGPGRKR